MIRIDRLSKSYGERVILRECSLEVRKGETLVVIGASGTGKSTLLRTIIGLTAPDSGRVFVDGQEVNRLPRRDLQALRARMGYLFQTGALINWLSVGANIALPLVETRKLPDAEVEARVDRALSLVGLAGTRDLSPGQLSGGMRKRVGLARSLVTDPEIILYDEPTTGLDPVTAHIIDQLIIDLRVKLGVTSVVVSHDMEGVYRVADRVAMLYDGRIIATGTPDEFRNSPDPIVQQFVTGALEGPLADRVRQGAPPDAPRSLTMRRNIVLGGFVLTTLIG
ncbi:MAG: ABC transporter ATP-binding protein [Planctomycetes bacterium]|nr:ABC transporter ATP-binding protein [Planctomycetota bacterium]